MSVEIMPGAPIEVGETSEALVRGNEVEVVEAVVVPAEEVKDEPEGEILVVEVTAEMKAEAKPKSKSKSKEVIVAAETAVAVVPNKVFYRCVTGSDMTDAEFNKVEELITKTSTVKSGGLRDRMRRCEVIIMAKEDGRVVGCMALRVNKQGYMRRVVSRARVSLAYDSLELCWIRVLPSRRGKGIEQEMFARLVVSVKDEAFKSKRLYGRKVFSIWPVEDEYNKALVETFGFTKTAGDQVSDIDSSKRVQMFTYGDQPLLLAN